MRGEKRWFKPAWRREGKLSGVLISTESMRGGTKQCGRDLGQYPLYR